MKSYALDATRILLEEAANGNPENPFQTERRKGAIISAAEQIRRYELPLEGLKEVRDFILQLGSGKDENIVSTARTMAFSAYCRSL